MTIIMMKALLCPATAFSAARLSQPRAQQIMFERKRAYQKYGLAVCSPRRFWGTPPAWPSPCPTCSESKLRC